ncbi:MAG: BBP7 family outer membrane beta-barrel protein [Gemmataceae bacterium]
MRGMIVAWAVLSVLLSGLTVQAQAPANPTQGAVYFAPNAGPMQQPVQTTGYTTPAPAAATTFQRGTDAGFAASDADVSFWFIGEYLYWGLSGAKVPPLLTTSPPGTSVGSAGVIGAPGTRVVYGGSDINDDFRSGFRVRAGVWLDEDQNHGIDVSFFMLEGMGNGATVGAQDGSIISSRPFVDATTGLNNAELVSFPGILNGTASVDAGSGAFWGVDALWRHKICCGHFNLSGCEDGGYFRVDLLSGFRYFRYDDQVTITEDLTPLNPAILPGTRILISDRFKARNAFAGGALGLGTDLQFNRLSIWARGRVNLGATQREVSIQGQTEVQQPGFAPLVRSGGLLALNSNIGDYKSSRFTVLPEGDITLGYQVADFCRLLVGYSIIYWPGVAFAGEQIDPVVNPNLIPSKGGAQAVGPARPRFDFQSGDLFVHGLTAGIAFAY